MLRTAVLAACVVATIPAARAVELHLFSRLEAQAIAVDGPRSWREGGWGLLADAGDDAGGSTSSASASARVGLELDAGEHFRAFAHLVGRQESADLGGRDAGLVEAWVEASHGLGDRQLLRARAGLLFPGTTRESVDRLWSSSYTLTLSALDTWTAEELRPRGVDVEDRIVLGQTELRLGAIAFGGADTAGALLAWRGWTMGERPAVVGEVLPFPPLPQLEGAFSRQRDDGTVPVRPDLDGRVGWLGRASWRGERGLVQAWSFDNRGDRGLHDHEYAWRTRLDGVGGELPLGRWKLVGEWAWGDSGMGLAPHAVVDVDVAAGYLMLAWRGEHVRASVRRDRFEVVDRDGRPGEDDSQDGDAWTVAAFLTLRPGLELAGEALWLDATRADPDAPGTPYDLDARSVRVALRWTWEG